MRSKLSSSTFWICKFPSGLEPAVPPAAHRCQSAKNRLCFGEFVLEQALNLSSKIQTLSCRPNPSNPSTLQSYGSSVGWRRGRFPVPTPGSMSISAPQCTVVRLMVDGAQHLAGHRGLDDVKRRHWACVVPAWSRLFVESFSSRLQLRCFYMLFDCRSISTSQEARLMSHLAELKVTSIFLG